MFMSHQIYGESPGVSFKFCSPVAHWIFGHISHRHLNTRVSNNFNFPGTVGNSWQNILDGINLIPKSFTSVHFSSVESFSHVRLLATPWIIARQASLVNHQLPESTQTHVHWVGNVIQPSHPLSSPSSPALNISQHQGLFQRVSSSHQVAKVSEFQVQHQSFQWTPRTDLL